jgi:hypothetical protein
MQTKQRQKIAVKQVKMQNMAAFAGVTLLKSCGTAKRYAKFASHRNQNAYPVTVSSTSYKNA